MRRTLLPLILTALLFGDPAASVAAAQEFEGEDRYRVFLLTMAWGDEVWERFGHNAILIRNESTGEELAWNWGLFDFADVDFIPRFLRGTMLYSMGPAPPGPFLESYARADRTVYSNEIHLSQEQARELDAFVRWNYLPENRHYVYDYFRDNCSTRIRDALDDVLDGAIRDRFFDRITPHTYRFQSRRMVRGLYWTDQGMSHLMGTRGDRPITEWEAMFLPIELLEHLEGLEVEDAATGAMRPLLGPREVLYQADRPPAYTEPQPFSPLWLVAGLLFGAAALGLGRAAGQGSRPARVGLGALGGAWGLLAGALGLIMVAATFTDHVFIHRNINILYTNPLALPMALLLLPAALRSGWWAGRAGRAAWGLAVLIAAGSVLAALLQAVTLVQQGNAETVALALPLNVALAWALVIGTRTAQAAREG